MKKVTFGQSRPRYVGNIFVAIDKTKTTQTKVNLEELVGNTVGFADSGLVLVFTVTIRMLR